MSKFQEFAWMVATSFQDRIRKVNVFVADLDGDDLYAKYLAAFPEGTDPIYKKNTEHDCSCCRRSPTRRDSARARCPSTGIRAAWPGTERPRPRAPPPGRCCWSR